MANNETSFSREIGRLSKIFKYPHVYSNNNELLDIQNRSCLQLRVSLREDKLYVRSLTQFLLDCVILSLTYYQSNSDIQARADFIRYKSQAKFGDIFEWECNIGGEQPSEDLQSLKFITFNVDKENIVVQAKKRKECLPFPTEEISILEPWKFENGNKFNIGKFTIEVIENVMDPLNAQFAVETAVLAIIYYIENQDRAKFIAERFCSEFGDTSWVCILGDASSYFKYQPKMFIKFKINALTIVVFSNLIEFK